MKITNDMIANKLAIFSYKPHTDITNICLQLFIENVVLNKDIKSYTMAQMDKAIREYFIKNNINIEMET